MLGIPAVTLLIVGTIGGIGATAFYTSFRLAEKVGPKLTPDDLRPCLPWEGLPFPRFFYTKPELLAEIREK